MFRELYEMLNADHLFNGGMEVEVLKGFYQYIPYYKVRKIGYREIRLSSYKGRTSSNKLNQ